MGDAIDATGPSKTSATTDDAQTPLAVRCVRALMERHGLPKYRQSAWLADATGLSYSQAHRRMTGASAWTLEDLERVGGLFGESLAEVVSLASDPGSVKGTLRLGASPLPCQLWLGEPADRPRPDEIVALQSDAGWVALPASEAGERPVRRVERMDVRPRDSVRPVIAVLDDDHDLTNTIVSHLETEGYDARPFYRSADLQSAAKTTRFDGHVVDWIVGESSTARLIAGLRGQDAQAPIVVLTAQVLAGIVDEADIADAVKRHDLLFHEKPVRMSILSATLSRAFAQTRPS